MSLLKWLPKIQSGDIRLVLGSASHARRNVLKQLGVPFDVIVSDFAEDLEKSQFQDPKEYPVATSMQKTKDIIARLVDRGESKQTVLITCDTVVIRENSHIMEKPESAQHSFNMIKSLSGKFHDVVTGVVVTLLDSKSSVSGQEVFMCVSQVKFVDLSDEEIQAYIETEEPVGKAGGYGIQGLGEILISEVSGSFTNVVGIPLHDVCQSIASLLDSHLK